MKRSHLFTLLLLILSLTFNANAQKGRVTPKTIKKPAIAAQKMVENRNAAIVVDEKLAVLRAEPSLFARPIQRMRVGRVVSISGSKQADGVTFYRVSAPPNNYGWVQSESVIAKSKRGDDERLAKLVQSFDGFEQIECATLFLETFSASPLRPPILLLLGDLMEETALKISRDATRKLNRREMAASGAPLHSFYLNFVSLDRFRKLGIGFLFNSNTKLLHYDGAAWKEIVRKFPQSNEAAEAQKRLDALKQKLEKTQ
jgi:hypothetical protein